MSVFGVVGTQGRALSGSFWAFLQHSGGVENIFFPRQIYGSYRIYHNVIINLCYINNHWFNLKTGVFPHSKPCQRCRKQGKRVMKAKQLITSNCIFSIGF